MDPFERWDDWEFEKAAREIGRGYRDDQEYVRSNWKDHRTYFNKNLPEVFWPVGTAVRKEYFFRLFCF